MQWNIFGFPPGAIKGKAGDKLARLLYEDEYQVRFTPCTLTETVDKEKKAITNTPVRL